MPSHLTIIPPDPAAHAEAIYALLDTVWDGTGQHSRAGRIAHSHYDWHTSRIGLVGERLATHYGVYDMTLRIGTARVRAGGINLVATAPDFQGQGLMHQTLLAATAAMRNHGYDISVVCNGIRNFYHRYGYVFAWPEMSHIIKGADIPRLEREISLESVELQHQGEQLLAETAALYNAENATVTGSIVRPTFQRGKIPGGGDKLTYWRDDQGVLQGYLVGDVHTGRNQFWQEDCAGDPAEIMQVWTMLLAQTGCDGVYVDRLGEQSALGKRLRQQTCRIRAYHKKNGGFMLTIINLRSLLQKLAPELALRLQRSFAADWSGQLSITCKDETVTLAIERGQVAVVSDAPTAHLIRGGDEIAQLIIGTDEPGNIAAHAGMALRGDAARLMEVLFPRQYPQINNGDL